jgi:hypothetical protein
MINHLFPEINSNFDIKFLYNILYEKNISSIILKIFNLENVSNFFRVENN